MGSAAEEQGAPISSSLREELAFWRFRVLLTDHIPWRKEEHVALKLSTDASCLFSLGGRTHSRSRKVTFGDFWEDDF